MNVLNMEDFSDGTFNVVIDKGCLDTILAGDCSDSNVEKMLLEIQRVLIRPGGVYICISYGNEDERKEFLKLKSLKQWDLKVDKATKPQIIQLGGMVKDEKDPKNFHYVYTMTLLA